MWGAQPVFFENYYKPFLVRFSHALVISLLKNEFSKMHLAWRNIRLSSRPRDHFFGKWVYAFGIRKSGWFLDGFSPVSRCFWNLEADFGADFGADSGADRAEIGFSLDALKVPKEKPSFEGFCSVFGRGACRFALV